MEGFVEQVTIFQSESIYYVCTAVQWYFEKSFRSVVTLLFGLYTYVSGLNLFPIADW